MSRVKKPRTCSECGSQRIAKILYGMPTFSDELELDIENGKIVLGGCVVTDHDPIWECVDCGKAFSRLNP